MKIKTDTGRVFDVTPGKMFTGRLYEPEWFPVHRTDIFEVGFLADSEEVPEFHSVPEIGDRIAVDFQKDGPFGEVWYSPKIVEIL